MEQKKSVPKENIPLVIKNVKFADRLARQFYLERRALGIELDEYVGAARYGLCDAARRYDARKGENFITFCYFRIRGALYDLLKQNGGISRSHYHRLVNERFETVARRETLADAGEGRLPYAFTDNISGLQRLSIVLEEFGIRVYPHTSSTGVTLTYAKPTDPETLTVRSSIRDYVRALVDRLPERERQVIERHYFEDGSFVKLREDLGHVSKSWVSRLHGRALGNLRQMIRTDNAGCCKRVAAYEK